MPRNPKPKVEIVADAPQVRRQLAAWFERQGRDLPWRRDHSPYAVMVSEFMLQQTQVATVIPYFERWMKRFPDFATLAQSSEEDVLSLWQGLGYYSRARNLQRAAKEIVERFGGVLPADVAAISSLPGVGRYTAGAIAAFAFDLPVAAVDGNIARVLSRMADLREPIDTTAGLAAVYAVAEAFLPTKGGRLHTSALMELGALVCTSRVPQCLVCPVRNRCRSDEPESLPRKRPRKSVIPMDEACAWMLRGGKVFLQQQDGPRWRGMWKLPRLSEEPAGEDPIYTATYPFTNHRVSLRVFCVAGRGPKMEGEWIDRSQLAELPLTAPHRRAIETLLSRENSSS